MANHKPTERDDKNFKRHSALIGRIERDAQELIDMWTEYSEDPRFDETVAGSKARGMARLFGEILCKTQGGHCTADQIAHEEMGYPMPKSGGR